MKKINFKQLIICILIPLVLGFIVGMISSPSNNYMELVKPSFAPPNWVFPVVWTILYIVMGISSYMILKSNNVNKEEALAVYFLQLIVNLLWSVIFFTFNLKLFAFIWIILLIFLVIVMIKRFYSINKISGLIQIPYLIWLFFAALLNISIYILN